MAPGWKTLTPRDQAQDEKEDPELDNPVPALEEGARISPDRGEVRTRRTQAPPRYTQAALIRELERRGIGRPSTYASIMGNISARGYVQENKKRQLEATLTGEELVGLMEGAFGFLEYGFTRGLEERLDCIAEGRAEYLPVVKDAYAALQDELRGFRRQLCENGAAACPACGEPLARMLREPGPGGRGWNYWKCRNPACSSSYDDRGGAPDPATRRTSFLTDFTCPDCGSPMRHLAREGGREAGGYNFWRCSKDDCMTTIDDRDGKPDYPGPTEAGRDELSCPECGNPLRRCARPGAAGPRAFYWRCSSDSCGSLWNDKDGAPEWQSRRISAATDVKCPVCDSKLRRYKKGPYPGSPSSYDYWACQDRACKSYFPERDGGPDLETRFRSAPTSGQFCNCCGEPLKHVARKAENGRKAVNYWQCLDQDCGAGFADRGGKPDPDSMWVTRRTARECPLCGSPLENTVRESGADGTGGSNTWSCTGASCTGQWPDLAGTPDFESPRDAGADGAPVEPGTGGGAREAAAPGPAAQGEGGGDDSSWLQDSPEEFAAQEPARKCPSCGEDLRHVVRAGPDGAPQNFWRCLNTVDCGSSFDDRNGSPDPSTRRVSILTARSCPACGGALRHNMKEDVQDGKPGWNYWSCTAQSCFKRYNDSGGEPDFESPFLGVPDTAHVCPRCKGGIRHLRRDAGTDSSYNYWKCLDKSCGASFEDRDGAPDPATMRRNIESAEHFCTQCGKALRHSFKEPGADGSGGWNFWACPDRACGSRYNDLGGAPDLQGSYTGGGSADPDHLCPSCGGKIRHLVRIGADADSSWNYWRCADPACGSSFDDLDGAPDPATRRVTLETLEVCPKCGEHLKRHVRQPGPDGSGGYDFWACPNRSCRARFDDANGAPDVDGRGSGRDLTDVPCPACSSMLKHLVRNGPDAQSSWNYWRCSDPQCGSNYDDLDGRPDPASRRITLDSEFECGVCGAKLRHHLKDPGPDGTGGWNFWACTDRSCRTRWNDNEGSPDQDSGPLPNQSGQTDVPCPACSSLLRHLVKKGSGPGDSWNYWKCPDANCGSSYDDLDGAPDPASRRVSVLDLEHTCPKCGRQIRHNTKPPGPDGGGGWNFWACSDRACNSRWNDLDGAPDFEGGALAARDLTDVPCPVCMTKLRHLVSDGSGGRDKWNYWKCPNKECGSSFNDSDGAPDADSRRITLESEHPCPSCGAPINRHIKLADLEGNGGWDFWSCSNRDCRKRFPDKGGAPDLDSPEGGLTDVPCPNCSAPLRHMLRSGSPSESYNYWKCTADGCGSSYEDKGGAPDPESRKVSVVTDKLCPTCGSNLRHVTRQESSAHRGYDFWSCTRRDCRTFLNDKGGEPDFDSARTPSAPSGVGCPECGKDLVHMQRDAAPGREGYNYWKCPDDACGSFFDDGGGLPDPSSLRKTVKTSRKCPKCGDQILHKIKPNGPTGRGWNYWACANRDCKAAWDDNNGAPGPERAKSTATISDHLCADCGKPLRHMVKEGEGGYNFWGCSGFPACRSTYQDVNGKPGGKTSRSDPSGFKCVRCGSDLYRRKGTSRRTGVDYDFFSCANQKCGSIYDVRDGQPDVPEAVLKRLAAALKPEPGKPAS
ncbi:MAG: hypothetical protein LBQ12_13465 [Deltaproteobacteria bacterium]|nr:hypothetical protein [Deltaproteobacteria bacterium]